MRLLISAATPLAARYGAETDRVRTAISEYEREVAFVSDSSRLVWVDEADSTRPLGLEPVSASGATSVHTLVLRMIDLFERAGSPVTSITIVGGDHVIPHFRFPNPVRSRDLDPDPEVLTDLPFGWRCEPHGPLQPEDISVGRLPDAGRGAAEPFLLALKRVASLHSARPVLSGSYILSNKDWWSSAEAVAARMPLPQTKRESPGCCLKAGDNELAGHAMAYFSLHGFRDKSTWQGFDRWRGQYAVSVEPGAFSQGSVAGATVVSENCYGAHVVNKSPAQSCALAAVFAGASAFVGSTGLAYGAYLSPWIRDFTANSGVLAGHFVDERAQGTSVGQAIRSARSRFISNPSSNDGLSPIEQKSALQFMLLGDPDL